jgi:AraC family transcriptional regulator of adaptative response / DNA-3-methyladenine glycosylase II
LRLVGEGALDQGSVETLADRLGVSARHLHRLFLQHLGASPTGVAQTRRLDFARQLISDTDIPMGEVAFASGFQSIRRFNDTFRKVYSRTPSELRRLRRSAPREGAYRLRLSYRPPFDWESLLAFLAARATPSVEEVRGSAYRRTFAFGSQEGVLEVGRLPGQNALEATIRFPDAACLLPIVARVRGMFDLAADPLTIARHFRGDPLLGDLVRAYPGLRIPGAFDPFELVVRAILGQQVSVERATELAGNLAGRFGKAFSMADPTLSRMFPTPEVLAGAEIAGLPRVRAEAIRSFSQAVSVGRFALSTATSETLVPFLTGIRGIGPWTAEYVAMRALNEPDAFPSEDLVLLRQAGGTHPLTPPALRKRAESWRPWRAYAAMYLWRDARAQAGAGRRRKSLAPSPPLSAALL